MYFSSCRIIWIVYKIRTKLILLPNKQVYFSKKLLQILYLIKNQCIMLQISGIETIIICFVKKTMR